SVALPRPDGGAVRLHQVRVEGRVREREPAPVLAPSPVAPVQLRLVDPLLRVEVVLLGDERPHRVERLPVAPSRLLDRLGEAEPPAGHEPLEPGDGADEGALQLPGELVAQPRVVRGRALEPYR